MRLDELLVGDISALVCGNLDAAAVVRLGFASKTLWGMIGQRNIVRDGVLREFPGIIGLPMGKSAEVYLIFLSLYYAPRFQGGNATDEINATAESIMDEYGGVHCGSMLHSLCLRLEVFFRTKEGRAEIMQRAESYVDYAEKHDIMFWSANVVRIMSKVAAIARSSFFYKNMLMWVIAPSQCE